jgi:RNA polymerase sigma-70 factor (ECF subfamily)
MVRLRDLGDESAWGEFAEIYTPLVRRIVRRRGLQDADAEDVAQEVLLAVAKAIERQAYDPERGPFRRWLFRVARNFSVNALVALRRHGRGSGGTDAHDALEAQAGPAEDDSAVFEAEYERRILYWAAEQVRGEFSEAAWRAFWETGVEGRPAAEVAVELGISVGGVYNGKSRVMARIRRRIEQVEGQALELPLEPPV